MGTAWIIEKADCRDGVGKNITTGDPLGVLMVDEGRGLKEPAAMWLANGDFDNALQFARRRDAEDAAKVLVPCMDVVICEHSWDLRPNVKGQQTMNQKQIARMAYQCATMRLLPLERLKRRFMGMLDRFVLRHWMRAKDRQHGFPCSVCGAKSFDEAADLCRGDCGCPGDTMSKDIFQPQNT